MIGLLAAAGAAALAVGALLPGIYTNEEQVSFALEAGTPAPPWVGVEIREEGGALRLLTIDRFGAPGAESQTIMLADEQGGVRVTMGRCQRLFEGQEDGRFLNTQTNGTCESPAALVAMGPDGLEMKMPDGTMLDLLRARPFKCWASIPRKDLGTDAKAGWWFKSDVMLHDRGGRALLETDEAEPQRLVLRMRNVVFPEPPNRPSLVLYVHGEDPVRAISYGWADPEAKRLGINLRTMQASCSLQE